jgi:hypothetical protein
MLPFLLVPCVILGAAPPSAGAYQPTWQDLRQIVAQLRSAEGTALLYQNHPGLARAYGDENSFNDLAGKWRDRLIPLPADPDDLDPGVATLEMRNANGLVVAYFTFHNPEPAGSLTFLKLSWEGRSLARTDYYRGFVRVTPVQPPAETYGVWIPARPLVKKP